MYDYSLLKGMKKYKIIYCCNKQYDGPQLENVEFHPIFSYRQDMNTLAKILSYFCSLLVLVGILRTERPDVLHIQWWKQWNLDYFFLFIYKRYAKQIVFTAHNLVPHDSGDSMKTKCMKYYHKVDKIIVHDNNSKRELIKDFQVKEDKIAVIAHGILEFSVDEEEVKSIMDELAAKYSLKDKLVFATMGGQSPYKGTDLICDAFLSSEVLKNNDDVFLIIAGAGDIATPEKFMQCSNVWVANYSLSDSEFQAIMRLTDVMLLPYRKISQSGVLLTAIQNQTPFAVTPIGGLAEPLELAPVGWIVPSPTIERVRDCMEKLAEDIPQTKAVKSNQKNWDLVKEKYNWDKISIQTENLYNRSN
jgi:glycosyltransferase involved in cell wall biosynthesis